MVSSTYLFPLVATLLGTANGFVVPSSSVKGTPRVETTTQVNSDTTTGFDSFAGRKLTDYPGGEEQRQLRRTVYTHDDWKKHRSQDRFIVYLAAILKSGVYKNLGREVGTITAASAALVFVPSTGYPPRGDELQQLRAALVFYNALTGGYTDFEGVKHAALISSSFLPALTLPMSAFTLTSPSLGLLLVFRTNSSYQRWDEARKNWGMNINHTRDLVRLANAYYDGRGVSPEQRADDLNHVALCTWAFVRSMKRHLSPVEEDEEAFKAELYEKLPEKQAEMILAAAHRPNRALQDLSYAIDDLPMHFIRKNEIHKAVTIFEDNLGSSERLLTSPVPLFLAFKAELYEKLPEKQAEMILAAAHRPNRALQDLSYAIDDLPMHFIRKNEIHKAVTIFEDNLGSSERLLTSPVPLFYSRHLARYLAVWLLLLPFGIYDAFGSSWNHIAMIPAIAVISTMLAGIEEIGTQLEEPFTVLPMQAFCDKIYNWCMEIVSWTPGDNGRAMRDVEPQHAFFQSGGPSASVNGSAGPAFVAAAAPAVAAPVAVAAVAEPVAAVAEPVAAVAGAAAATNAGPALPFTEAVAAVAEPVAAVAETVAAVAEPVAAVAEPVAEVAEPVAPVAEPVAEVPRPARATQLPDQSLSFEDFLKSQGRRAVRPN
eukprot:CAMPEP_0172518690 /NCGR_PEP_ID=MMETSP1066-20121228/290932_1 /TAXON_ID=671091 /ORGANISM="Coscinodiscus wailesii, Strain CCMP2513" /LENGTH=654 /DNA_ID=CAMNT_0013301127 /DNA_START=83 /DNA_END=2050 /DNA_ORIENTATION=+